MVQLTVQSQVTVSLIFVGRTSSAIWRQCCLSHARLIVSQLIPKQSLLGIRNSWMLCSRGRASVQQKIQFLATDDVLWAAIYWIRCSSTAGRQLLVLSTHITGKGASAVTRHGSLSLRSVADAYVHMNSLTNSAVNYNVAVCC